MSSDCCCKRPPGFHDDIPGEFPDAFPGEFAEVDADTVVVPNPLFNFAPGQAVTEYGTDQQLPAIQPFYESVAEMNAAGIQGDPSSIYLFDEPQNTSIIDRVGTDNLTAKAGFAGYWKHQNTAVGFWDGSSFFNKKCIVASGGSQNTRMEAANVNIHSPGVASFGLFVIYNIFRPVPATACSLFGSKSSAASQGFFVNSDGGLSIEEAGGLNAAVNASFSNNYLAGGWRYLYLDINRSTNIVRVLSPYDASANIDITGWGAINNQIVFAFGAGYPTQKSHHFQLAYAAIWKGAQAETLSANWAANEPLLWTHGRAGLTNVPVTPSTLESQSVHTHIGYEAGFGERYAGWNGLNNIEAQLAYEYNPALSRSNKIGVATRSQGRNFVTHWDTFGSSWTIAAGASGFDINEPPTGCSRYDTPKLTTAGVDALARHANMGVAAGTDIWAAGCCYRRATGEAADVDCKLILYDVTNGAEISSVALTATAEWQWVQMDNLATPVGCANVSMHLVVEYNGLADQGVAFWGMTVTRNKPLGGPISRNLTDSQPQEYTDIYKNGIAEQYLKHARGELEIIFAAHSNYATADQTLFRTIGAGGLTQDMREVVINTSKQIAFTMNNGVVAIATVTSAAIADLTTEHTVICRWNRDGLPSGNKMEVKVDAAAAVGANPAAWAAVGNVTNLAIAEDGFFSGNEPAVTISSVRIWEKPR